MKLKELIEEKVLEAQVYAGSKGVIPVILNTEDLDINQEVLSGGFADRRFISHKVGSGSAAPQSQVGMPTELSF